MKELVVVYPIRNNEVVLLGWKKTGLGEGLYNGFGGHVKPDETRVEAAERELKEECRIIPVLSEMSERGELIFHYTDKESVRITLYTLRQWIGEAKETEEMAPKYFNINALPFEQMWDCDRLWLTYLVRDWEVQGTFTLMGDKLTSVRLELYNER